MKLGAVLVVYAIFGIWTSTNRIGNVLFIIAVAAILCMLLSAIGRLVRSDNMVSSWQRRTKVVVKIGIIGIIAMFTWPLLLKWIF